MSVRDRISSWTGEWSGTNRVWLAPGEPVRESEAVATVTLAARGSFTEVRYTWSDQGEPQDGILLIRISSDPGPLDMVWIDSWHTGGQFMTFRGEGDREGAMSALGSYSAPSGPDWGWRIMIREDGEAGFRIIMHNITPDGKEALAVESCLCRVPGSCRS